MPSSKLMVLTKPKSLRVIILSLIVLTVIIGIYHLFYGQVGEPLPTEPATPLLSQNGDFIHDSENTLYYEHNKSAHTRKVGHFGHSTNSEIHETNQCLKQEAFVPKFDAQDVFPTFEFDADWIRSREYWNSFFEQRYLALKNSKQKPDLKVIVLPHSHNDPGWLKTFEGYFIKQTKNILDNAVEKLSIFEDMKFIWSEISFLSKWWDQAHPSRRELFQNLVKTGKLEIVTGGWVMTDEATVNLFSMIDQLIEGQQWVKAHFNTTPQASWSIDPFGHGSAFPYILKESGINSMVIQRIHYAWKKWLAEKQQGDFRWVQRWDSTGENSIFCHNAPFDIYSIKHSCGPHPHICLNFDFRNISGEYSENYMVFQPITPYNVKEKAELMLEQYGRTASLFPHNVALISLGDDFRFDRPIEWDQQYYNYKKLFDYINENRALYHADVNFGTLSDYFKAVKSRSFNLETFSGDFFVYSDIFSEGRPAYWSGYYGTRPFWKKFYRETEDRIRSAEFLFSFANNLMRQQNKHQALKVMNREYENLVTARRWLALYAHHDATTGTSKTEVMHDYGWKLLEASKYSLQLQSLAISHIVFGDIRNITTDYELNRFGDLPKKIPVITSDNRVVKKLVLFNSLSWFRSHLVKVIVTESDVEVIGPDGDPVLAQVNPVINLDSQGVIMSSSIFELTFVARLPPLAISLFEIKKATTGGIASKAMVYCKNCTDPAKLFGINRIEPGDIQLTNDKLQLVFDRNTGFLESITDHEINVKMKSKMSFGGYNSMDFKSGAYLLMLDPGSEQQIPFAHADAKILIISGPVSSEVLVVHSPMQLSTRILHTGGPDVEKAIFIQNQMDLGRHNAEVYMRFSTDLNSTVEAFREPSSNYAARHPHFEYAGVPERKPTEAPKLVKVMLPTMYTDQNGFTVEKRVKVESIGYEGNSYPVNTMAYLQDEDKKVRFSVLVDRTHGFSSMENGRIEALIERRTVFDDARGMGEGVTDNKDTISNYILLLEKVKLDPPKDRNKWLDPLLPTLAAHHGAQELSYPPAIFVFHGERDSSTARGVYPFFNQEFPCDTHVLNLRSVSESLSAEQFDMNFPSSQALLIVQKFGHICNNNNVTCANSSKRLFYPKTAFNSLKVKSLLKSSLAGFHAENSTVKLSALEKFEAKPFEIKSFVVNFV